MRTDEGKNFSIRNWKPLDSPIVSMILQTKASLSSFYDIADTIVSMIFSQGRHDVPSYEFLISI